MATESVQLKVSGMMCSFCTMSIDKALKHYPRVQSFLVNPVHTASSWSRHVQDQPGEACCKV